MRFIMIEDSSYKVNNFKSYLNEDDKVTVFNYFTAGMYELVSKTSEYDVLILDMNFPVCKEEEIEKEIGFDVLRELKRKKIEIPVVIFSSEKNYDLSKYNNVIYYIKYDSSVSLKYHVDSIREIVEKKISS